MLHSLCYCHYYIWNAKEKRIDEKRTVWCRPIYHFQKPNSLFLISSTEYNFISLAISVVMFS